MPWIEAHSELGQHPKLRRLARCLSLNKPEAVGHLVYFWWWAMSYAPDGDLSRYDDGDIADGAMWEGDPTEFVKALRACGFLDDTRVHDWADYGEKLHRRRQQNAARMREARERANSVQNTCAARADDSPECAQREDRTGQERTTTTVEDRTEDPSPPAEAENSDLADSACRATGERLSAAMQVFGHFKARIFPAARVCPTDKIEARLRQFTPEELKTGIDHFAEDHFCMTNNARRGAAWFFQSDARSEQFLHMTPEREKARSRARSKDDRECNAERSSPFEAYT